MENQSPKQYYVPSAYLANFTDRQGNLCCHDSKLDNLQQDTPENTAFASVNAVEDTNQQKLLDYVQNAYAQVDATAEKIFPKLTSFQSLDPQVVAADWVNGRVRGPHAPLAKFRAWERL